MSLPSDHLEAALGEMSKQHKIGIAGTIVHGRIRGDGIPTPPSVSPFSSGGPVEWHAYLEKNKEAILENVDHIALENEAFLFDTAGEVCGRYVKRNLWHPERDYLSPGEEKGQVFDTPWGKIGFLICVSSFLRLC
jgi:predicted amidohydrolase